MMVVFNGKDGDFNMDGGGRVRALGCVEDRLLVKEEGESWDAHQCWECGGLLKMVPDHHERRLVFTCQSVLCGKVLCSDHNAYEEWLNA